MLLTYLANSAVGVLRLRALVLDDNMLTYKCAGAIHSLLSQHEVLYNTLTKLSLRNNSIGDDGVTDICRSLIFRYTAI
jgi:hypothetical protein